MNVDSAKILILSLRPGREVPDQVQDILASLFDTAYEAGYEAGKYWHLLTNEED